LGLLAGLAVGGVFAVLATSARQRGDRAPSRARKEATTLDSAVAAPLAPSTGATSATTSALRPRTERSAYVGCGQPIPDALLWRDQTETEVLEAISEAKDCARVQGRRLLLEFVAPWCKDCREVTRLDQSPGVARVLRERFERVRINVGEWDNHRGLLDSYDVRALATYIVIDPHSSKLVARTTLEPISKPGRKLSPEEWANWLSRF
jgi:thiol:disulfide interchange protein